MPQDYPTGGLSPAIEKGHDELHTASDKRPALPVEEDIMQLARLGEIGAIQKLFAMGKFDANYKDEQGITPLHWAAQRNHYALCHFLMQSGADVNAKGGDLMATPVAWAARNCNLYVVNLLLENGADPLRSDNQGFNLLHSAAMDGSVFQLLLILYHDTPVDTPDTNGHTSLMWAAYKGFPPCVEALLKWGASVDARDEQGFTPLHWALVRGSQPCIQKLIEYGADRFATTTDGKTPATVAKDMNSVSQWHRALADCGYGPTGQLRSFHFAFVTKDRISFVKKFFFFWPFLVLCCVLFIVSRVPIYAGLPLAAVTAFALQTLSQQCLQWAPPNMKHLHHTPYMAGVFGGTLFWTGVAWLHRILPHTYNISPFSNALFGLFLTSTTYFYFLIMIQDPGYVPRAFSRSEQKSLVDELVASGTFDDAHFCINCMVRRPVRSKHCRRCARCVAKQDHHCPWVNNCVAVNNHRQFFLYIVSLAIGIAAIIPLAFSYIKALPASNITKCTLLSPDLCDSYHKDPFTVVTVIWASLQLSWVSMLLFVQLVQVARNLTTYEIMTNRNMNTHQPLAGVSGGASEALTSSFVAGTTSFENAQLTSQGRGPDPVTDPSTTPGRPPRHGHARANRKEGCFESWKKLLGVDTFLATAMHGDESSSRHKKNPFNQGVVINCKDFFCDSSPVFGRNRQSGKALLGGVEVDYTRMWTPPTRERPMTMPQSSSSRRDRRRDRGEYQAVSPDESV